MDKFVITGGNRLTGEVIASGAKDAAIAITPAATMVDDICRIENTPNITDVTVTTRILYDMGTKIRKVNSSTIEIDPRPIHTCVASYELTRRIHGSYYLLGALLGRFHRAMASMPGGCDFGVRPIDQHLEGSGAFGAIHALEDGMVGASAKEFIGNSTYVDVVSIGATVNTMLAAVRAKGTAVIENVAKEFHIVNLTNFLNPMEADVCGAGTDVIKVYGVEYLKGTTYSIIPDQVETETYMVAATAIGGDVLIRNVILKHLESVSAKLEGMGVTVEEYDDSIRIKRNQPLNRCNIKTMLHPGLLTDMQSQIAIVLSTAHGTSITNESVWDNRFRYAEEPKRMGAQTFVDGKLAAVEGINHLNAAPVRAADLRTGAVMLIAALYVYGVSQVEDTRYVERGCEDVEKKLLALGADIKRVHVSDPSVAQAA